MTTFRFNIWDASEVPPHVVRHGLCVEVEADTYEAARAILVTEYASGRRQLSLGPLEQWKDGGAELVAALRMLDGKDTRLSS